MVEGDSDALVWENITVAQL